MAQIPLTLVIALVCIGIGEWPGVSQWSELTAVHHAAIHALYLIAGGLVGIQVAWWSKKSSEATWSAKEESKVIS